MARAKSVEHDTIHYPDSDGKPLADNDIQRGYMVSIHGNLADMYGDEDEVCVHLDMLWYPKKGHPEICVAPDVFVAFGRPRGHRGSYKQWDEGGHPPDVVFEVLSPHNTKREMEAKLEFYQTYKVKEYYLIDPYKMTVSGWLRKRGKLTPVPAMDGFVSPLLKIRFDMSKGEVAIYRSNGEIFRSFEEELRRSQIAREDAAAAKERAEEAAAEAEKAIARAERLAAKLRELGVDPEAA